MKKIALLSSVSILAIGLAFAAPASADPTDTGAAVVSYEHQSFDGKSGWQFVSPSTPLVGVAGATAAGVTALLTPGTVDISAINAKHSFAASDIIDNCGKAGVPWWDLAAGITCFVGGAGKSGS
jgi:hypothetical protein